jgi:hypothetical protein
MQGRGGCATLELPRKLATGVPLPPRRDRSFEVGDDRLIAGDRNRLTRAEAVKRAQRLTGGEINVSKILSTRFLVILPTLALAIFALFAADAGALAQNTNSSTTQDNTANTNVAGGTDTDLSGTYTGTLNMTGGHEMSGQATLTITGNQFTLAMEGMTHTGRVLAVTTRGYTGVSFFFSDIDDTETRTPLAVSVRARRRGDRLTLEPVPGARTRLSFR